MWWILTLLGDIFTLLGDIFILLGGIFTGCGRLFAHAVAISTNAGVLFAHLGGFVTGCGCLWTGTARKKYESSCIRDAFPSTVVCDGASTMPEASGALTRPAGNADARAGSRRIALLTSESRFVLYSWSRWTRARSSGEAPR